MVERVIRWSLEHRALVVLGLLAAAGAGLHSLSLLPLDAFPDTSPVQVQVNALAPALPAEEVERLITAPVEGAIGGLPALEAVRSTSRHGICQVTAVFADGADPYRARQLVAEALAGVHL